MVAKRVRPRVASCDHLTFPAATPILTCSNQCGDAAINPCSNTIAPRVVGLISDTHGLLRPEAVEVLRGVELIVHAGDIGGPDIVDALRQIAPVHAVRGNVDRGSWADDFSPTEIVEVGDQVLYVLHDLGELDLDPAAAGFRVVVSGHSHHPKVTEERGVVYLNPGSAGPRRLRLPISIARMVVGDGKAQSRRGPGFWPFSSHKFGSGAGRIEIEMISLEDMG